MMADRTIQEKVLLAYGRQSLGRSGDHGDSASVADQFRSIEDYAARIGGRIVGRFSDVDVSGGTESREGLDRLLETVKQVKPHAVLIRDVSRLARDTRIFLTLVDTLQRSGVQLMSATENLEDRTLATVISAMSERERLMLAARIAGGVREHARRGKTHGRVAFGYRRLDGALTIWEPEAAMVRAVFAAFAAGDSVTTIINRLNGDPATPPAPEVDHWGHATITRMLKRAVYAGDVEIASRRDIGGRQWPTVLVRDAHPAIVPREVFDAVQRRFRAPRGIVRHLPVSPFAGFLWCAACGGRIYAVEHQRPDRPNNLLIARCCTYTRRFRDGEIARVCPGAHGSRALARVERLAVEAVRTLLTEQLETPEAILAYAAAQLAAQKHDGAAAKAKTRLADIERRRARLLEAYESGSLDLTTWQGRDRVLTADAEALTEAIAREPEPVDTDKLLLARARFAELGEVIALDFRAVLTEFGARVIVDLDNLSARVVVGPHYAPLFTAGVADPT